MDLADLPDRIAAHYERHARAWDADRRAAGWNDRAWHERFISALPDGAGVLDLGCGGGSPVALNMVACGLRVCGVDVSPAMVSLYRERMPGQDWRLADMRSLCLDRRFGGILAWDSLFHLDHDSQRRMFRVFAEHAAPGTVLMFNAGPIHGESIGEYRGDPLYHASLAPAEYRSLLAGAGFRLVAETLEDRCIGGRSAWLANVPGPISGRDAPVRFAALTRPATVRTSRP